MEIVWIFIGAVIINNFVLSYFLGICPFLGMSHEVENALSMGMATTFVTTLTGPVAWLIYHFILVKFGVPFLQYVSFIVAIASLVQFVEMYIRKFSPALYRAMGIFLPLITTNCIVLGLALFEILREYNFIGSVVYGFGAGAGFTLALVIMAGIREELLFADIPEALQGAPMTLILAGLLALAFMGFSGLLAI